MRQGIKGILFAVTPPIIYSGINAVFQSKWKKRFISEKVGEKDAEWYDVSFEKSDQWRQHYSLSYYYFLWTVIADRITREGIDSILEIGCGPGQLACLIRDKGVQDYQGFDFSSKRIAQARKICPEFSFSQQDAFETDLFITFDYRAVICTEFLEHIERDIDILNRIKSGTIFYGTVPNFPFTSHVRHFMSENDVISRYEQCFRDLRVDTFSANDRGRKYFLIEGRIA